VLPEGLPGVNGVCRHLDHELLDEHITLVDFANRGACFARSASKDAIRHVFEARVRDEIHLLVARDHSHVAAQGGRNMGAGAVESNVELPIFVAEHLFDRSTIHQNAHKVRTFGVFHEIELGRIDISSNS